MGNVLHVVTPSANDQLTVDVALFILFPFCLKGGVICISEVIDISPGNLDSTKVGHA